MVQTGSGITAAQDFIDAFNAQDHERLAATLNYPHVRLANGRFMTVDDAAGYANISRSGEKRLQEEGWHHSVVQSAVEIHAGPDKVHVAMTVDRCREDGTVYETFDTLWIATLDAGHWGIQFRSSFLRR